MINRHKNAIRKNDEIVYVCENEKHLKEKEKAKYWENVHAILDAEIEIHELYILVKDRVERCGK